MAIMVKSHKRFFGVFFQGIAFNTKSKGKYASLI